MKKILLVICCVAVASLAFAQSTHTPTSGQAAAALSPSFTRHQLNATYVSTGDMELSISSGYQFIDSAHTILCPGTTGGCQIQADAWLELGFETYTFNEAGVCLYVDGLLVNGTCWYSGEVPADNSYVQISSSINSAKVPFGNHTVQTGVYTVSGAFVGYYNINYKVYKP